MQFADALTSLIDSEYAQYRELCAHNSGTPVSRDVFALTAGPQLPFAAEVGVSLTYALRDVPVSCGTFHNGREYGITYRAGGWSFAASRSRYADGAIVYVAPRGAAPAAAMRFRDGSSWVPLFTVSDEGGMFTLCDTTAHELADAIRLVATGEARTLTELGAELMRDPRPMLLVSREAGARR